MGKKVPKIYIKNFLIENSLNGCGILEEQKGLIKSEITYQKTKYLQITDILRISQKRGTCDMPQYHNLNIFKIKGRWT